MGRSVISKYSYLKGLTIRSVSGVHTSFKMKLRYRYFMKSNMLISLAIREMETYCDNQ